MQPENVLTYLLKFKRHTPTSTLLGPTVWRHQFQIQPDTISRITCGHSAPPRKWRRIADFRHTGFQPEGRNINISLTSKRSNTFDSETQSGSSGTLLTFSLCRDTRRPLHCWDRRSGGTSSRSNRTQSPASPAGTVLHPWIRRGSPTSGVLASNLKEEVGRLTLPANGPTFLLCDPIGIERDPSHLLA